MEATDSAVQHGNHDDPEYDGFLARVAARFTKLTQSGSKPLFTTDADGLFGAYLGSFATADLQQHHNCNACKSFIRRFGHLVVMNDDGTTTPAIWDPQDAPAEYRKPIAAMAALVERAKVNGVFLSSEPVWGQPITGIWRHLHVRPVPAQVYRTAGSLTHGQAMAEKREDFKTVVTALQEFTPTVVEAALKLLESDTLYRSERVIGPARWLRDVHVARDAATGNARNNVVWRAIATAPVGFCHPRSSMVGTLLEDIAAGLPYDDISRRFAAKMDAQRYQRAQAAPSGGQVEAAERAVEALGIAPAFERRYATDSDFNAPGAVVWQPSEHAARATPATVKPTGGVFDHLKPAAAVGPDLDIPPKKMTLEKLHRDVLPGAAVIQYRVPLVGHFGSLTAAADASAAPILQWDGPEIRNTVSWSFPNPPARAEEWNLQAGALVPVRMIVNSPNGWNDVGERHRAHGRGIFMLLDGARDVRALPGGGLFIEHLRGDLKPYRATIEAHLNKLTVAGADARDAAFGLGLFSGTEFTEAAAPKIPAGGGHGGGSGGAPERIHVILVIDDSGSMRGYIQAARNALRSLLAAVRAMPGQVDATVSIFGNLETVLAERVPLSALEGVERNMHGASGGTALNDTILSAINRALDWPDSRLPTTSFFLGIVTDGEENQSRRHVEEVAAMVRTVNATGRWTVAYAGAGSNPRTYARRAGIPDGNVTVFEASARGFEDVGARYASSTVALASAYAGGARSTTSFFGAAASRQTIGSDHPVFVVTTKSGAVAAYELDRWE